MFSGLLTNFLAVLFFFVQSSELRVLYEWHFLSSLFRHFPTHRNIAYDAFLEFLKKYSKCNQRFGKWRRVSDFRECTVRSISDISFISSLMLFTKVKSNEMIMWKILQSWLQYSSDCLAFRVNSVSRESAFACEFSTFQLSVIETLWARL